MIPRKLILTVVLSLIVWSHAHGQALPIMLTTIESAPLWASTIPNDGFLGAIAREAFRRAGYDLAFRYVPFARAMFEAEFDPKYAGIFGFYYAKNRESTFLYSEPIYQIEVVLLALKSRRISYTSPKELSQYSIGVLNGADYGDSLRTANGLRIEIAPSKESNVRKLLAGRVDLIVEIKDIALNLLAKENASDLVEIIGKPIEIKPLYIGFTKSNPESRILKTSFDKALQSMKSDGKYETLRNSAY